MAHIGRLCRLDPQSTVFLLCDIQERFRTVMPVFGAVLNNTNKLLKASKVFEIPLLVTEQYPEKLGHTAKEFDISHACSVVPKTRFSMLVPEIEKYIKDIKPRDVVLFGLETHVCVEQTAMDLIARKLNVLLVADCCCSRTNQDRDLALRRLSQIGCIVTSYESVIFNLLADKNHPKFKEFLDTIKEPAACVQIAHSGAGGKAAEKK